MHAQHDAELIVRGSSTLSEAQVDLIRQVKSVLPDVWVTIELEDEIDWFAFEPFDAACRADRIVVRGRAVKDRLGRTDR